MPTSNLKAQPEDVQFSGTLQRQEVEELKFVHNCSLTRQMWVCAIATLHDFNVYVRQAAAHCAKDGLHSGDGRESHRLAY